MKLSWEKDLQDEKKLQLFLDKEPWKIVHCTLFRRPRQIIPTFDTLEAYDEAFPEIELRRAKNYALRLLCRKAYLSAELHSKLKDKLVSTASIYAAIDALLQLGYVDDQAYLKGFVESQLRKKKGSRWIEGRLRQKGVHPEQITHAIAEYAGKEMQLDGIASLLEKRFKTQNFSEYLVRQKATAFLMQRGYQWDDIQEALSNKIRSES